MKIKVKYLLPSVALLLIFFTVSVVGLCLGTTAYAMTLDENLQTVYLGGMPIGIRAVTQYFVVTEIVNVTSKDGSFSPAMQAGIKKGDLIVAVNGKSISDLNMFNDEVQTSDKVIVSLKRGANIEEIEVVPAFDVAQNSKKIGMLIKNDITGMGTLTMITKDKRFGALGHIVSDEYGYGDIYSGGSIYDCTVTGYNKPRENVPGELRSNVDFSAKIGEFSINNSTGIYGNISYDTSELTEIAIADKDSVVPGKAHILSTISGNTPELYEIEIIKAVKQDNVADKSMVIRVTDKRLKDTTGGILQGMSGSPIIQNDKLVGAVTHVFINDPGKGYGIYAQWMMKNFDSF
ncbi:MAG: SpoIVB peptidase S55 domain-containing protein [Christensenellales bacterium]